MLAPILALLLVQHPPLQEQGPAAAPEDPRAVLEELIERSNALRSFRATYVLEQPGEPGGTIELAYLAPDRMRIDVREDAEASMRLVLSGSELCMAEVKPGESPQHGRVDLRSVGPERTAALAALEWSFPSPRRDRLGAGPELLLHWHLDEETDKVDFSASIGWAPRRSSVLGWFEHIEEEGALAVDGTHLVQVHPRYRARFSRETSFLEELRGERSDGKTFTVRLESLELDPELTAEAFAFPERPDGARDLSEQMLQVQLDSVALPIVRRKLLGRIDRMLHAGHIRWSTSVTNELERALRVLHEPTIEEHGAKWSRSSSSEVEEFCEWIDRSRGAGVPLATLRPEVEARRALFEERLAASLAAWNALLDRELPEGESSDWSQLLALEGRLVEQLHAQHVTDPTLERFDRATAEALDG